MSDRIPPVLPARPFVGPARVLSGFGSAGSAADELLAAGVTPALGRILLVADAAVLRLGLVEPVADSLRTAGFDLERCAPVSGEPTSEMVRAIMPDGSRPTAGVVAVGAGSALDAAKILSLLLANDLDLTAGLKPDAVLAPGPLLLAIPTTAGTGSEATAVAMLWHDHAKKMFVHPYLVPRLAILDPDLLTELPQAVVASSGMDAICHAIESLLSTFSTPLTESAAFSALGRLAHALPDAYATAAPEARHQTQLGAFQAGLALNASVVLGHSMAYTIASRTGLPHGVTCAMALPYCLAHSRPSASAKIAAMAEIVCGQDDPDLLLRWVIETNVALGIPSSLADVGIKDSDLRDMAQECMQVYARPNHPTPIELSGLEHLYGRFHRGEALEAWADGEPSLHEAGVHA